MAEETFTAKWDALPFVARLLIQIFTAGYAGAIYRICKYCETKNSKTLVNGILSCIPGFCFVFWVADVISLVKYKSYSIWME